jgi:hypothetical protein
MKKKFLSGDLDWECQLLTLNLYLRNISALRIFAAGRHPQEAEKD